MNPEAWSDAVVKIGPFGVLAVLCAVCIYVSAKIVIPWLDRKDDRHAKTIEGITKQFREAMGEQAIEFSASMNHNTTAMNKLAEGITEVREAVEHLTERMDEHENRRSTAS